MDLNDGSNGMKADGTFFSSHLSTLNNFFKHIVFNLSSNDFNYFFLIFTSSLNYWYVCTILMSAVQGPSLHLKASINKMYYYYC